MPMIDIYAVAGTFCGRPQARHQRGGAQVLTNAGALDRDKQLALAKGLTDLVAAAANNPELKMRTRVLLTEAAPGCAEGK